MVEFLALDELGDQHVTFLCFDQLEQFEEVGVVDSLEDCDLPLNPRGILFGVNPLFVEHFDCDWFAGGHVDSSPDLSEGAGADVSFELKVVEWSHMEFPTIL
jgi:hypothetical protein